LRYALGSPTAKPTDELWNRSPLLREGRVMESRILFVEDDASFRKVFTRAMGEALASNEEFTSRRLRGAAGVQTGGAVSSADRVKRPGDYGWALPRARESLLPARETGTLPPAVSFAAASPKDPR
jgi:hypothetical protein